jgi:hypothetical protein
MSNKNRNKLANYLHSKIANLENVQNSLSESQMTILAHARIEWSHGNYIQVEKDLARIKLGG